MGAERVWTRRKFLSGAVAAGGGLLLAGCGGSRLDAADGGAATGQAEEVTPGEDLMREHGVLRRVLLIYEECLGRMDAGRELPPAAVRDSTEILRTFIENYHEKLEEDHLFPRFERAGVLVELTKTLRSQHAAGRAVTAVIVRRTDKGLPAGREDRDGLSRDMRAFIRMYRPHAAREDTVLFPALRRVYSPREYEDLGDAFEDKEHELFGESGFEKMVDRVAGIEKALGIYDLAEFTPKS